MFKKLDNIKSSQDEIFLKKYLSYKQKYLDLKGGELCLIKNTKINYFYYIHNNPLPVIISKSKCSSKKIKHSKKLINYNY